MERDQARGTTARNRADLLPPVYSRVTGRRISHAHLVGERVSGQARQDPPAYAQAYAHGRDGEEGGDVGG